MKRTVWITGACGFSGRHLIRFLRTLPGPLHLVGLDCRSGLTDGLDSFHVVDMNDGAGLEQVVRAQPPHRVFHLAGLLPPAPEAEMWRVNVGGTQALLQTLARAKTKRARVLSVGSAAEYLPSGSTLKETHPCGGVTPYGRTKWAQSVLALACGEQLGLDVVVARTFNLLGPGLPSSLVAGSLCAQFSHENGAPIRVGNLKPRRDFVDVRDAVRAYWHICEQGRSGGIYNVCRGQTTTIETLLHYFSGWSGGNRKIESDSSLMRRGEFARVCGDSRKLRRLGWSPSVSIRNSIRDMLAWTRAS